MRNIININRSQCLLILEAVEYARKELGQATLAVGSCSLASELLERAANEYQELERSLDIALQGSAPSDDDDHQSTRPAKPADDTFFDC